MAQGPTWTIADALTWTRTYFAQRGLDSPRLDAEVLLADVLKVQRVILYAQYDRPLGPAELAAFRASLRRRAVGEPVAYIVGSREFFGHRFAVNPSVLVPRPETEHLVEQALAWMGVASPGQAPDAPAPQAGQHPPHIVDIGCGSGAIALSIACALPDFAVDPAPAWITGCDISPAALAVAQANAAALLPGLDARLAWAAGDLMAAAAPRLALRPATLVVANLPYIPQAQIAELPVDVRQFEPHLALDGGVDGLQIVARLLAQAAEQLVDGGALMLEVGAGQAPQVAAMAAASGHWRPADIACDLSGHQRILTLVRAAPAAC